MFLHWRHAGRLSATVRHAYVSESFLSEIIAQTYSYVPWINRSDMYRPEAGHFAHILCECKTFVDVSRKSVDIRLMGRNNRRR
jgi:hypothetical protein